MTYRLSIAIIFSVFVGGPALADVNISSDPTQNMSCSGGVCTATAKKAVLNVGDLQTMLASGDVTVKTGTKANNIEITQPLTWASTSRLTLDAQQSVVVNKAVSVSGTGALTIATNDGGSNGGLFIGPKANVQFADLTSSLIVDGNAYTLVGDIKTLAADISGNSSGFYAIANNYDASNDGNFSSSPIATPFSGSLEGLGNSISHLRIELDQSVDYAGFFYKIGTGAVIRHLRMKGEVVEVGPSSATCAGLLAGRNFGLIESSAVSGAMQFDASGSAAGGVVCVNSGTVSNSAANIRIHATSLYDVGGLAALSSPLYGQGFPAVISDSHADGTIEVGSVSSAGGIAGVVGGYTVTPVKHLRTGVNSTTCDPRFFCSYVSRSWSSVTVSATSAFSAGGLFGGAGGSAWITESYATGAVSVVGIARQEECGTSVGGLIGFNHASVENAYASGAATAGDWSCVGGLFGAFGTGYEGEGAEAAATFSTGHVSAGNQALVGGFAGKERHLSQIKSSYWDVDTSGTSQESGNGADSKGVSSLSDGELKSALPKGFDRNIWGQSPDINNGYPYLLANPPQ